MSFIELQFSIATALYLFLPINYFSSIFSVNIFSKRSLIVTSLVSILLGFTMLPTLLWEHAVIALGVHITNPWFNPHLVFLVIFGICLILHFYRYIIKKIKREQTVILMLFTAVFVVANLAHWTIIDKGFGPSLRDNGKFVQAVLGSQRFYGSCIELDLICHSFKSKEEAVQFARSEDNKYSAYTERYIAGESNIQTLRKAAFSQLPAASSDSMHGWFEPNPMNNYVSKAVEGNSSWKGYFISDSDRIYRYVRSTKNEGETKIRAQEAFFVALLISEFVWVFLGFLILRLHMIRR